MSQDYIEAMMNGATDVVSGVASATWDEILGAQEERCGLASRALVLQAQKDRAPVPSHRVVSLAEVSAFGGDDILGTVSVFGPADVLGGEVLPRGTVSVFGPADVLGEVLGSVSVWGADAVGSIDIWGDGVVGGQHPLPLARALHRDAGGPLRPIRVDTEESYADFRVAGAKSVESRLDDLERAFSDHVRDPRAHYARIPLSLDPETAENAQCWRQGDVICCSLRAEGPGGVPRWLTTTTPAAAAEEEVVGLVARSGVDPADVAPVFDALVGMFGGGRLVPEIASAAPSALDRPEVASGEVFLGRMVPDKNPSAEALLHLCQMAQAGHPQAASEWASLAAAAKAPGSERLAALMSRCASALTSAQRGVR